MSTGRSDEGYPPFEMADPRILAIMGSGETAPTMAKVHRALFDRLGAEPNPAVIIDTPYGFQENADDLSARTVQFFRERLGRDVAVATYRNRDVDAVTSASAVALVRGSRYLMTGPGSPSYALRQWAGGPIPSAIVDRLRSGGVVTMASAAALTLGVSTIPVYEIYKVGEAAHWLPGLDILGELTGLRAAVVPHLAALAPASALQARVALARGSMARERGDAGSAMGHLQALADSSQTAPKWQRERMRAWAQIGLVQLEQGAAAEAIVSFERALKEFERLETRVTPARADALVGLGRAHLAQGDAASARAALEQADSFWRGFDPASRSGAEAAEWLARAKAARRG